MNAPIEVFKGAPAMEVIRLREIYEMNQLIFADAAAMDFLKLFIARSNFGGTIIDQYIQLKEQFDEVLQQSHLEKYLTLDDVDDFDGLPKSAEDKLRAIIRSEIGAKEKDQSLRKCLKEIQAELKTAVVSTKTYKIFQSDIKKALQPYGGV